MSVRRIAKLANLVVAAVLMLGVWLLLVYVGSRPALRTLIDLTPQQVNSVDRTTVELLRDIGDRGIEVEFHLFFPIRPGRGATPALEQGRVIEDRLRQATRMLVRRYQWLASESITVKDHRLSRVSDETDAAVNAFDYKGVESIVVVAVRQQDQERRFRKLSLWHDLAEIRWPEGPGVGEDPPPVLKRYLGEVGLSSAMKSLLVQGSPVAYLLKGFEQGLVSYTNPTIGKDYGTFISELAAHGFRVAELDLRRAREVPRDAALVILLEPKRELPDFEAQALEHYVRGGGRLFVNYSWSPIGVDRNPTGGKLGELLGFEVGLRPIFHLIPDYGRTGGRGLDGDHAVRKLQLILNGKHPVTRMLASSGQPIEVAEARELRARASPPEGITSQPLLWTGGGGWLGRPGPDGRFDYTAPRVGLRQFQVGLAIEVAPRGVASRGWRGRGWRRRGGAGEVGPQRPGRRDLRPVLQQLGLAGLVRRPRAQHLQLDGRAPGAHEHPEPPLPASPDEGAATAARARAQLPGLGRARDAARARSARDVRTEADLMGFHTTLVLLLIVAGLGGVLWFTMQEPPVDERDKIHALEGRSLGQCTRMRWQLKDHIAFEVVRREDGRFGIVEPVVDRASLGYLTQIVRAWDSAELVATEFVDDETGRRDAGLLEPAATFSAEWPGGDSVSFEIGGKGALGDHRLVRRNGKIWQGRSNLYQCLNVNREDLRDHQVFLGQEGLCFALRVEMDSETGKREALELRRREGQWRLVSPWDSRAEPTTAVSFVTSVLSMRADTFLSGMIRTDGEPDVVVVAETGMGEERLELWVDQGAAYGQLPGRTGWFQFDPRTFESVFHRAMRDLRARTLVPFKNVATELAELVVDFGKGHGGRVRLLRESVSQTEAWELLEPVTYPVNWTAAGKAIQGVNNLVVIEFVENLTADEAETGLRMPGRLAVSVRGFREQQATTFWFGSTVVREGLEFCYACRADEPQSVVLVPAPAVEQLRRPFPEYCELDVLQIRVQIERIELEKPRNEPEGPPGERRIFARNDRHWLLEGAEGHRDEVRDFVNDVLRDLRGKQALDLRDGVLGEPSWTIAFCRGNGDRITALRVWDRGAEQPIVVQAAIEEDLGFEVSALISKQLRELWQ